MGGQGSGQSGRAGCGPGSFSRIRQRATGGLIEFLRSRSTGAATIQEFRYACRQMGLTGMDGVILDWLTQDGMVKVDHEIGTIYLTYEAGGKMVPPAPETPMPTGGGGEGGEGAEGGGGM